MSVIWFEANRRRFRRFAIVVLACALAAGSGVPSPALAQLVERVSVGTPQSPSIGAAGGPALSGDGRFVVFDSLEADLVSGDFNGVRDVFLRDRIAGQTVRVSLRSDGSEPAGETVFGSADLSRDGQTVVFASRDTGLVTGLDDTNNAPDIFLRDLASDTTVLVSARIGGGVPEMESTRPALSDDGTVAVFVSGSQSLVASDTNGAADIFLRPLAPLGPIEIVSRSSAGALAQGGASDAPSLSADGQRIAFVSAATNLTASDTNGLTDVFVRNRISGTTVCASVATGSSVPRSGFLPALSGDGRFVVFLSDAPNLVADDTNGLTDVFVRDLQSGTTELISRDRAGRPISQPVADTFGRPPAISGDGRFVAFATAAPDLVAGDTDAVNELFLRDRLLQVTHRVALSNDGQPSGAASGYPSLDGSGRFLAFLASGDDLVSGDSNNQPDAFVRDAGAAATFATNRIAVGPGVSTLSVPIAVPDGAPSVQVGLPIRTVDDTAAAGVDYVALDSVVIFSPGATTTNVTISLVPNPGSPEARRFHLRMDPARGWLPGAFTNLEISLPASQGGSTGSATGAGTAGSTTGSPSGGGTSAGTGTGATSGIGGTGGQGGLQLLPWSVTIKRPKEGATLRFQPGRRGLGNVRGRIESDDIDTDTPLLVEVALVTLATNAGSGAPPAAVLWRKPSKVSRFKKNGRARVLARKFGADAALEAGARIEVWMRASDGNFARATSETGRVGVTVRTGSDP